MKRIKKDLFKGSRIACEAQTSQKNVRKNQRKNACKNVRKNVDHKQAVTLPVKAAVSANKGSDLLLLGSNNAVVAGGQSSSQPLPLYEGQTVFLRRQRRLT